MRAPLRVHAAARAQGVLPPAAHLRPGARRDEGRRAEERRDVLAGGGAEDDTPG